MKTIFFRLIYRCVLLLFHYLVESGFSRVSNLLWKACNQLDIVQKRDIRLSLTKLEPNIAKLETIGLSWNKVVQK